MYPFTVFNRITGEVVSSGSCSLEGDIFIQNTQPNTSAFRGTADRLTQKIKNPGQYGMSPVGFLEVIAKTPEEIEASKPTKRKILLTSELPAAITNKQWQDVLSNIKALNEEV